MNFETYLRIKKNNAIADIADTSDTGWEKCNSLVGNFIRFIQLLCGTASRTINDTTNTARSVSATHANTFRATSALYPSGNSDGGILLGTGVSNVGITNVNLHTKLPHGTGSNQLVYGSTSYGSVETIGNTTSFVVERVFTNSSGSSITIREAGFVVCGNASSVNYNFLVERTQKNYVIANGESITVQYKFQISL